MLTPCAQRSQVDQIAPDNWQQAYKLAQAIAHPWYRCQSLTTVSEYVLAPKHKKFNTNRQQILRQAVQAAFECHDENRRVVVAMWPMAALIRNNFRDMAMALIHRCIAELRQDPHPISRWYAAVSMVYCIKQSGYLLQPFIPAFIELTQQGHGWKMERDLHWMIADSGIQAQSELYDYCVARLQKIQDWKAANHPLKP
ncbi:MAG: hypothetical protein F6J87_21740 [Spirulina sp. SIO3F2]|nr:hypothetical protein [Spirulina sp. SIO3F2]